MSRVPFRIPWFIGKKGLPPKWVLALDAHVAWGVAIPSFTAWALGNFTLGAVLILAVALLKEIFADPYFEGEPFFWNGLGDWFAYCAGVLGVYVVALLLKGIL